LVTKGYRRRKLCVSLRGRDIAFWSWLPRFEYIGSSVICTFLCIFDLKILWPTTGKSRWHRAKSGVRYRWRQRNLCRL